MLKRVTSLYTAFVLFMMALLGRIAYINNSSYSEAAQKNTVRTLVVADKRPTVYDRNYEKLTNSENRLIAVVTPLAGITAYLSDYMSAQEMKQKINKGFPFTVEVKEKINNELIRTFEVPIRYSANQSAVHLIGYTDSKGQTGVSGIEKAYNDFMKENSGTLSVSFQADAKGRILPGMDKYINDSNFSSEAGVVLTIDKNIQQITEKALQQSRIESGCAIVMHVDTGEILSLVSVPTYDPGNLSASLDKENSPFVNKALQSYCVGSVFKPLVAAAALECGKSIDYEYECEGEITVGDTVFRCFDNKKHGKVNMSGALENSCNTYFINLIMNMDVELLLSLCKKINLGESDEIYKGCRTATGIVPDEKALEVKGEIANLAFGQGGLMMTPIQMLKMYHVLATGNYIDVSVVRGLADSRCMLERESSESEPVKILSDSTVNNIRQMLSSVVEKGNADKAHSTTVSLAGKTGTAQSGIYEKGKEICRTWFSGFFPSENPHYIVVVMNEKGKSGNSDCAPVFRKICEEICGAKR